MGRRPRRPGHTAPASDSHSRPPVIAPSRAPPGARPPSAHEPQAPALGRRDARREPDESGNTQAERERQRSPRAGAEASEAGRRGRRRHQPPRARPARRRHPERRRPRPGHVPDDGSGPTREAAPPPPEARGTEDEGRRHPTGHPINARRAAGDDGGTRGELADRPRDGPKAAGRRGAAAGDPDDARGTQETGDGRDGRGSRHGERGEWRGRPVLGRCRSPKRGGGKRKADGRRRHVAYPRGRPQPRAAGPACWPERAWRGRRRSRPLRAPRRARASGSLPVLAPPRRCPRHTFQPDRRTALAGKASILRYAATSSTSGSTRRHPARGLPWGGGAESASGAVTGETGREAERRPLRAVIRAQGRERS